MKRFLIVGLLLLVCGLPCSAKKVVRTTHKTTPKKRPKQLKTVTSLQAQKTYASAVEKIKADIDNAAEDLQSQILSENATNKTLDIAYDNLGRTEDGTNNTEPVPLVKQQEIDCRKSHAETMVAIQKLMVQAKRLRSISPVPQTCRNADILFVRYSTEMEMCLTNLTPPDALFDTDYQYLQQRIKQASQYLTHGLAELKRATDSSVAAKKYVNG